MYMHCGLITDVASGNLTGIYAMYFKYFEKKYYIRNFKKRKSGTEEILRQFKKKRGNLYLNCKFENAG